MAIAMALPPRIFCQVWMGDTVSESEDESDTEREIDFRDGGRNRAPPFSRIDSANSDDDRGDIDKSNSELFPIHARITFSTAETERPSFNPTFDAIPPECASNSHPNVLRSDPDCPCGTEHRRRARIFSVNGEPDRVYRERSPSRWSGSDHGSSARGSSAQGSTIVTRRRISIESDWNSCVSATNGGMSSCDYPPSLRSTPYLPQATSKAAQMIPPDRDYRWNLIRRQPPLNGYELNQSPAVPATSPVIGNPIANPSPGLQRHVRSPTMGRLQSREVQPHMQRSTTLAEGQRVSEEQGVTRPGGEPRNTKH